MADTIEIKRRLQAIRRLSASFPARTAKDRLQTIEDIASGKADPSVLRRVPSANLEERLLSGQASRSPRNAADKRPVKEEKAEHAKAEEKKRKKRGGHDRKESGGLNRSSDVND